MDLM